MDDFAYKLRDRAHGGFPDELLVDSTRVAKALREEVGRGVRFYVLADAVYGSCCVDEVSASHVDADCVVHYGNACMSPTSTLPALFIFGRASLDVNACAESLCNYLSIKKKSILVLFGLEYAHTIHTLRKSAVAESSYSDSGNHNPVLHFAEVACTSMTPSKIASTTSYNEDRTENSKIKSLSNHSLGGLTWNLPEGSKMEDYSLFWIGSDNSAFANIVLTFNGCDIVRFDTKENHLVEDTSQQKRTLKHRYYLVEKAKDANIVGILAGTLGVAGYLHSIQQMKELIDRAGKKSYILVMGRPNPAKLANFPECDVFVYVSCAQTALLDSKEFLAPVITPFEAMIAFSRGSHWTGEYILEFRELVTSSRFNTDLNTEEARFSFLHGGYVEDAEPQENEAEQEERSIVLAEGTEKSLSLETLGADSILFRGEAKSGAEFFAARSYHGLDMHYENSPSQSVIIGRTGRASGYDDEKNLRKT